MQAHGIEWRIVMRQFGLNPERLHDMPTVPGRKTRKFRYICSCSKHTVGAPRHNRMTKGARYTCRECKQKLIFLSEITNENQA